MSTSGWIQISVKVIPKAKQNAIVGWEGEELKVRIAANPEKGEANNELIRFLSEYFQIAKAHIHLISGHGSRHKRLELFGITPDFLKGPKDKKDIKDKKD